MAGLWSLVHFACIMPSSYLFSFQLFVQTLSICFQGFMCYVHTGVCMYVWVFVWTGPLQVSECLVYHAHVAPILLGSMWAPMRLFFCWIWKERRESSKSIVEFQRCSSLLHSSVLPFLPYSSFSFGNFGDRWVDRVRYPPTHPQPNIPTPEMTASGTLSGWLTCMWLRVCAFIWKSNAETGPHQKCKMLIMYACWLGALEYRQCVLCIQTTVLWT